ncbi:MAG: RadC family protein [Chitinophagia bacterium]|jgi:DNA repair protein RadC
MENIKNLPLDERPREKMRMKGMDAMGDAELLAILIQNGNKEQSALELAHELMRRSRNRLSDLSRLSLRELMKTKGIGMAKAITILAALELGKRRMAEQYLTETITGSASVAKYLQAKLMDLPHEVFAVLFLNRANRIRHFEIISSGGMTGTVADPRIILKKALEEEAVSIILCHNHPSGNLNPSRADEEITRKINHAAKFFDIMLLDHIIVSTDGYFSFADEGLLDVRH